MNYLLGFRRAAEDLGLAPLLYVAVNADPAVVAALGARPLLPTRQQMFALRAEELLERLPTAVGILSRVWDDVEREGVSADDIVLFAEASAVALFDLGRWLGTLPEGGRPAVFVRFLGEEIKDLASERFNGVAPIYRMVSRLLSEAAGSGRVFFTINSASQVSDLARACARRVFLMPMPKYYGEQPIGDAPEPAPVSVYVHVTDVQWEKTGRRLAESLLHAHPELRVVLKYCRHGVRDPAPTETIRSDGLTIVTKPQPMSEYMAMIHASDIVVLPYWPASYRVRNSGVFCEAAAFGKIIVAPAKTWMAGDIESERAAGVLFDVPTPAALTVAIEEALRNREELSAAARSRAPAFRAEHSCARNLALMLEMAATPHDMAVSVGESDPIDFTSAVASRSYLADGWSHTEAGYGVWSEGGESELVLHVAPGEPWPQKLRFTVAAYVVKARPRLDVEVLLNGIPVAEWRFTDRRPCERSLSVPAKADGNHELRVTFRVGHPVSPRQLGLSVDERQLGILLRRLEFGEAPATGQSSIVRRTLANSIIADTARRAARRLRAFAFRWV